MEAALGGLMSTEDAAAHAGVSKSMLTQASNRGRVQFEKRYGKLWFLMRDVDAWIKEYQPKVQGISQVRIINECCRNCRHGVVIYAAHLCRACYEYRRRTGQDRVIAERTPSAMIADLRSMPERPPNMFDRSHWDESDQEWMTQKAAAELVGITRERMRQLANAGKVPTRMFDTDKATRVLRSAVELRYAKRKAR